MANDGTDVYIFAEGTGPGVVKRLENKKHKKLRFAASVTGSFDCFAVAEADDNADIHKMVDELFGGKDPNTGIPLIFGPTVLRWTKQYPAFAFVRIAVEHGKAQSVLDATAKIKGYNGSAAVAGSYDVLVEIGADNLADLKKRLVEDMHPIEGIRWSESHFVTAHYYRGPKSQ